MSALARSIEEAGETIGHGLREVAGELRELRELRNAIDVLGDRQKQHSQEIVASLDVIAGLARGLEEALRSAESPSRRVSRKTFAGEGRAVSLCSSAPRHAR